MASEVDGFKTNEFLRRRKLRLQQVREQSKDIAKKIRQRAKVEKLRHVTDIDAKKQKEYIENQEQLVKRLELLYSKSLQNVGAGHKDALEVSQQQQDPVEKDNLSKLRGREAVVELRKRKQAKLDEQKKILDRKLRAREVANELSREKSSAVAKNLIKQSSKPEDPLNKTQTNSNEENNDEINNSKENIVEKGKSDMGTQWECGEMLTEWEPNIPTLSLPKDSGKDSIIEVEKLDKNKRLNLFALSDEMPSSLRGGLSNVSTDPITSKPSLTLVSEYLQNRNLRLRENEPSKTREDLRSIKNTILHTRASRTNVTGKEKPSHLVEPEISLSRKKSISVYNHNTRDMVDIPFEKEQLVFRDSKTDQDAYAQALMETNSIRNMEKEQLNKRQEDLRNKVAITRQNVDKEYRDTLSFLNSLPKDTGTKPIRTAYMDEHQQQLLKNSQQQKLQQEFKKIEKECYKHKCGHSKRKSTVLENSRSKSKSPINKDKHIARDFEYSWMPVPESDGSLAIHTIPNTRKTGNSVKFSETDSYHEYRSRHKHTPPTKDGVDDRPNKRIETVIVHNNDSEIESSTASETSSIENLNLERDTSKSNIDSKLKDAERIIIYKILDSRNKKKSKVHKKSEVDKKNVGPKVKDHRNNKISKDLDKTVCREQDGVPFENLQEGVYKAVRGDGHAYNVTSCYTANVALWQASVAQKSWWDNITSMHFSEDPSKQKNQSKENNTDQHCSCGRNATKTQIDKGLEKEENSASRITRFNCKCDIVDDNILAQPSTTASTMSFKTAANDKVSNPNPGDRFIKLIDEGGQENGKFYIGASGFIKEDNYEVVIQLRKKEAEKGTAKEVKNVVSSETLTSIPVEKVIETDEVISKNVQENIEDKLPVSTGNIEIYNDGDIGSALQNKDKKETKSEDNETESPLISKNNMCEKAVHTSFHDTYPMPIHEPKTNPILRPATSTYTQTSFNSSIQRPVFMHMSSSTSTAYMSPPELVLPKFLRQDYVLTREELYESENTTNQLGPQYDIIDTKSCKEYEDCTCKYHSCSRKATERNINAKNRNNNFTPPNTGRTNNEDDIFSIQREIKKRKCMCRKCKGHSETKVCHKSHRKRSYSTLYTKSSKDLPHTNVRTPISQLSKYKSSKLSSRNKLGDPKINPIVKQYVHKLLDLNKEGLKAIEIMNQDCSIATTPGSSIVNVPSNKDNTKSSLENKISLEQIKNIMKQQVFKENFEHVKRFDEKAKPIKVFKKKSLHKVKSLNISRQLQRRKKYDTHRSLRHTKAVISTSSSTREEKKTSSVKERNVSPSSKSSMPRPCRNSDYKNSTSSDVTEQTSMNGIKSFGKNWNDEKNKNTYLSNSKKPARFFDLPGQTMMSSDSEISSALLKRLNTQQVPANISTQTNGIIDAEINFMKLAEDKLQNMEKIADLTDKCTKRLSNLAKVLEEVRRNKSLVYSQFSTSNSTSISDNKSEKNAISEISMNDPDELIHKNETLSTLAVPTKLDDKTLRLKETIEFTPFLKDIPKPGSFKVPSSNIIPSLNDNSVKEITELEEHISSYHVAGKTRGKPPPALARINLKNGQDAFVTPHELSTVIEVDSPMSLKLKNKSSRHGTKVEDHIKTNRLFDETDSHKITEMKETQVNPDLLQTSLTIPRPQSKSNDSDNSKIRMMDMKEFNDIMLKPFISLQEYAKQCNIGLDEGSNTEEVVKNDMVNDDLSSLHSDCSLPDVIAELLKRNIINEPFKFDTASNINSTTMSSESTISLIALSKARKEKNKSGMLLKNKENIAETSEALSVSSNPDLENAFQKLGMGWASSTLKKTKERLALSSSSNTSSSSMTRFKIKSFSQEVPAFATDSTSSLGEVSNKREKKNSPSVHDSSKNAVQQTSLTNSMTVKEFLTNVLAKKITFNNKSRNESGGEFVSLYETNIPDEMKHTTVRNDGDQSSVTSINNNRARTSTPVQIFKSTAYHSSSSSNTSNGLFSNADDLSSVKVTSTSIRNHSTSDKDELTIPNYSLKTRKGLSDRSKSD